MIEKAIGSAMIEKAIDTVGVWALLGVVLTSAYHVGGWITLLILSAALFVLIITAKALDQ